MEASCSALPTGHKPFSIEARKKKFVNFLLFPEFTLDSTNIISYNVILFLAKDVAWRKEIT
jgi:hypothetical protein